jgi:hypothetical protein
LIGTNHVEVHTATADRPKINFGKSTGPTTQFQNFSQREVRPAAPPQVYNYTAPETRVEYRREPYVAERVEYRNEPVRVERTEYRGEAPRVAFNHGPRVERVERVEYVAPREESYVRVSGVDGRGTA